MPIEAYDGLMLSKNFGEVEYIKVPQADGHGGGNARLRDKIFRTPKTPDAFRQTAGSRDGAMAILVGIGARKSKQTGQPVRIEELSGLKPKAIKAYAYVLPRTRRFSATNRSYRQHG